MNLKQKYGTTAVQIKPPNNINTEKSKLMFQVQKRNRTVYFAVNWREMRLNAY